MTTPPGLVGVLGLQGDIPEHFAMARRLVGPGRVREVKGPEDLSGVAALLLPGGESTTLSRLLDDTGLRGPLGERLRRGLPCLATCAGLILIAREVERSPHGRDPVPLGILPVKVRRNDYGRQAESFEAPLAIRGLDGGDFPAVFIRAPRIVSVDEGVEILAHHRGEPVAVRQGRLWGLTFHPEISEDPRVHAHFLREAGLLP
jgi:5'-phosphate synthase pdxT subunit